MTIASPRNCASTYNSIAKTVRKAVDVEDNIRHTATFTEINRQVDAMHEAGEDTHIPHSGYNNDPQGVFSKELTSATEPELSKTKRENEKIVLKDFTVLNFSGLFTFRRHMTYSPESFERDYLFVERIGKGWYIVSILK